MEQDFEFDAETLKLWECIIQSFEEIGKDPKYKLFSKKLIRNITKTYIKHLRLSRWKRIVAFFEPVYEFMYFHTHRKEYTRKCQ